MPGVSGNKSLSAPVETLEESETVEPVETLEEPEIIEPVETLEESETDEPSVIPSEAKNLAEANAEPETELAVADEAANEPDADEILEEPEIIEPVETLGEPEIIEPVEEPAAAPVERQSETAEESVSIIDDELMRFKAATEGFDRLEKFTFKIFKDVFDNYSGVFVTARQTLADLLLFIAAKCKNAGKIEDFKRAFNIDKDFGKLNQSAANYIPVLLGLTLKLKAQSDFVSGVFNEIRGILLNIICDETAVEFELKILKQLLF